MIPESDTWCPLKVSYPQSPVLDPAVLLTTRLSLQTQVDLALLLLLLLLQLSCHLQASVKIHFVLL